MLPHLEPAHLVALFALLAAGAVLGLLSALSRKGRTEDQARAYLAGVTYVLSDDPDAAIAELSRAAQLRSETLETYFALGALFRRKGELDRAIRLHRNILLRTGLSAEVRRRAELALALDYRGASLTDKALEVLGPQVTAPGLVPSREALVLYRQLLEDSGSWEQAIAVQGRLLPLDPQGQAILAHLLAAHARALIRASPADAEAVAARAVEAAEDSADAQLALAEARLARGRGAEAVTPLERALALEAELAPGAVVLFARAGASPDRVADFLAAQRARGTEGAPLYELALALHERSRHLEDQALPRLRALVERNPRFWEARRELGALLLEQGKSEEMKADYLEILGRLGQPALSFGCSGCRQKMPAHVFRCPACQAWGTVHREEPRAEKPRI